MSKDELNSFKKRHKINYPLINYMKGKSLVDFIQYNLNWGGQIPFMVIFDKNGDVRDSYYGMQSEEKLSQEVEKYYNLKK